MNYNLWWNRHEHLILKSDVYTIQPHNSYLWRPISGIERLAVHFRLP